MKKILFVILTLLSTMAYAQRGQVLEEVVAVVGDHIIMKSDLEAEYLQAKTQTSYFKGDLKCEILNQLIIQKLYLHKGNLDSVAVSDEQVDSEVDRRVKYYAAQIGGERQLEKYLGKPIDDYKAIMRPRVKEQIIIQEVQRKMVADVKVSPTDVRKYFQSIPTDSLPMLETEVEVAQIIMAPEPNKYAKEYAYETIQKLRQDIINKVHTFEFAARSKSDDPGTAVNGGELGYFGRGQMVGEFERVAYKLKQDSISEIVETEYGYHILQLIDRKGEQINVRHILIKPLIVNSDFEKVKLKMEKIISDIKKDSIGMCNAASKYSSDQYTKDNCGYFTDQLTGAQQVPVSSLDPEIASIIKHMEEGTYTEPMLFTNANGTKAYRFIYLRKIVPEHLANMKDDYQKIQSMAQELAREKTIADWVKSYRKGVYVNIDEKYKNCEELKAWSGLNN